ncbi:MAG: hypothetical protein COU63_04355 [Candidatus Pacebacteria bacterium CG10_big_fil_rev_8_21_14_0_10_36_11]|nr:hypothetical protein [Candidatus Pacearchaeota archaeon]OIP74125.1 MAG: hypothetical protein AUK08_02630 [Candidatus Pacebacteria bacterium CG2_30_36_39]PIR64493.1 MAG: hypothetical protein COU63_04355 [Candidatus Pacebacteria bacterium CG10_big_fil_rev_8_21_14_0_10_36_11]PJC42982.1 MAG: hypothetical protein CO040_01560 [Candidatus Pacebacteria bacterium CG_4_9_14_0_2_um_filter_36_8]
MFLNGIYLLFLATSTLLFQILGFALLNLFLPKKRMTAEVWAWGRIVGWLVIGLFMWFLGHLLPFNTDLGFWLIFIFTYFVVFIKNKELKSELKQFVAKFKKEIILFELIFLFGFIFLGLMRTYNPQVLDLEKFMDGGLMQRYLVSPTLPIQDMWLAGEKINYYTFGHFLGSLMLRFWKLPMEWGYNILLAYILGLMCIESFAFGRILLKPFIAQAPKKHLKRNAFLLTFIGLLSMLLVNFAGNTHPLWYLIKNGSFDKYWYPDATRFIERTIHEFPAYSYIVSDLHAHVWAMPIVILMLFIAWEWKLSLAEEKKYLSFRSKLGDFKSLKIGSLLNQSYFRESLAMGAILGILAMTSTWDTMIYGLFLAVLGVFLLLEFTEKFWLFVFSAIAVGLAAIVSVSLWMLNFTSISQGVFLAYEHSPFWQLIALWGGHFLFSLLSLIFVAMIKFSPKLKPSYIFLLSMGITAFILLVLPELIYFKDIYPNHPRANTMFKFTFQAFILMSFLISWGFGMLLQKSTKSLISLLLKILVLIFVGGFFLVALCFPFLGYPSYYGHFKTNDGWDGLSWMKRETPADYQAILWLRKNVDPNAIILEAVGESYSKKARVSVFTGMPTVLGWRVHEWLWRGGFAIPGQRTTEVAKIFEQPNSVEASNLLNQYKVKYIFVGSQEKIVYKLNHDLLVDLGKVIYSKDGVYIIER